MVFLNIVDKFKAHLEEESFWDVIFVSKENTSDDIDIFDYTGKTDLTHDIRIILNNDSFDIYWKTLSEDLFVHLGTRYIGILNEAPGNFS
jgi:hypothetical protein